ncbi:Thiamine-monophosphate kinase (EC 2.7.4.16), partial [Pseudomonas sp. FEN]
GDFHRHPGGRCALCRPLRPFPARPARAGRGRQRPGRHGRHTPGLYPGPDLAAQRRQLAASLRPRPEPDGATLCLAPGGRRHHPWTAVPDADGVRSGADGAGLDPRRRASRRPAVCRRRVGQCGRRLAAGAGAAYGGAGDCRAAAGALLVAQAAIGTGSVLAQQGDLGTGYLRWALGRLRAYRGGIRVRLQVAHDALPLSSALRAFLGQDGAHQAALSGGDDYVLAFTLPADEWPGLLAAHPSTV